MKIVLSLLGVVVVLVISFLSIGLMTAKTYQGQMTQTLPCSPQVLWKTLTDLKALPDRHREIAKVEILGTNAQGLQKWKEYTDMGGSIVFETIEEIPEKKWTIRMSESTFGMQGVWTYELAGDNTQTHLTILEDSQIDKIALRSLITLMGRNINIKREFKTLQKALAKQI